MNSSICFKNRKVTPPINKGRRRNTYNPEEIALDKKRAPNARTGKMASFRQLSERD
jgi:hypothetical protein